MDNESREYDWLYHLYLNQPMKRKLEMKQERKDTSEIVCECEEGIKIQQPPTLSWLHCNNLNQKSEIDGDYNNGALLIENTEKLWHLTFISNLTDPSVISIRSFLHINNPISREFFGLLKLWIE